MRFMLISVIVTFSYKAQFIAHTYFDHMQSGLQTALAGKVMRSAVSVGPSAQRCPSVSSFTLYLLNQLTSDLDFLHVNGIHSMDHDHSSIESQGQGQRSMQNWWVTRASTAASYEY